ncbi:MAG: acyl-CoA thioesterase [Arenicella sp.]
MPANHALSITSSMRVAFYDVDSYRVVWHGAYPKYLEIARGELLEKIGYTYADMEREQFFFPIIDMQIKYIDSLLVGQQFNITATLKEWQHKLVIDYLITDSTTGKRITKARTTQAAVKMPEKVTQFDSPHSLISAVEAALNGS